jgi:hypothetical protein
MTPVQEQRSIKKTAKMMKAQDAEMLKTMKAGGMLN